MNKMREPLSINQSIKHPAAHSELPADPGSRPDQLINNPVSLELYFEFQSIN